MEVFERSSAVKKKTDNPLATDTSINVHLTTAEKEKIEAAARDEKRSTSQFIRFLVMETLEAREEK